MFSKGAVNVSALVHVFYDKVNLSVLDAVVLSDSNLKWNCQM